MRRPGDMGMSTAEYTVGTLGAAFVAVCLVKLGLDGGWLFEELKRVIERALEPGRLLEIVEDGPWFGIGRR